MKESKLSSTQKTIFTAMLLALAVISTFIAKSVASFLPFSTSFPFLRFSLTPAIIFYASITLGPISGLVVGVGADLIPALGSSLGDYDFLITIVYAVFGVLPWCLEKLTKHFRAGAKKPYAFYAILAAILVALATIFYATDWLDSSFGKSGVWAKPTVLGAILALDIGMGVGLYFTNGYYQKRVLEYSDLPSPNEVAFISVVSEVVVLDALKAFAFYAFYAWIDNASPHFGLSFMEIFGMLLMGSSLNVLISTFANSWLLIYTKKFIRSYGYPTAGLSQKEKETNLGENDGNSEKNIVLEEETAQQEKDDRRVKTGWIVFFTVCLLLIAICLIVVKIIQHNSAMEQTSSALNIFIDKVLNFVF